MKIMIDGKQTGLTARWVDPDSFFRDWIPEMQQTVQSSNPGSSDWRLKAIHPRFGKLIARWAPDSMVGGGVGSMVVLATQL